MKLKQLAFAAVRFYALILVLRMCMSLPALIIWRYGLNEREAQWMFFANLCGLLVTLAIAIFLFLRTRAVVNRITPGVEPEADAAPRGELGVLAFSVAGLVFLVQALELLVQAGVGWYLSAGPREHAVRSWTRSDLGMLLQGIVVALVGLWLLLGSKGILRAVQKLQRPPVPHAPSPRGQ